MTLFSLVANFMLTEADNTILDPIQIFDKPIRCLAYADDIVYVAKTFEELDNTVQRISHFAAQANLIFNPSKCGYLKLGKQSNLPTLKIYDQPVPSVTGDQYYKYLGVPFGHEKRRGMKETLETCIGN